ncbi:MAG: hypothetical protein AAF439_07780 [Pseudomonadota bacterium]
MVAVVSSDAVAFDVVAAIAGVAIERAPTAMAGQKPRLIAAPSRTELICVIISTPLLQKSTIHLVRWLDISTGFHEAINFHCPFTTNSTYA